MSVSIATPAVALLYGCAGAPAGTASTPPSAPPSGGSVGAAEAPPARLADLVERYWQWTLTLSPEFATQIGDHRYDDRVSDLSDRGRARTVEGATRFLEELRRIDPGALAGQDRITHEILDWRLTSAIERVRLGLHLWDVDHMWGVHLSFPHLMREEHPRRDARDLENLLARYRAHPRQIDDVTAALREGLGKGYLAPRESVRRVIQQLGEELGKPAPDRVLAIHPARLSEAVPEAVRAEIARASNDVIAREIHPALGRMREMLEREYQPRTREDVGAWTLPNGGEAYRFLIREHTSTERSAQEIHDLGVAELARIAADMLAIARRRGHKGDLKAFARRLRDDPANFYADRAALLAGFRAIHDRAWAALPRVFGKIPTARSEVRPMAAYQERDSAAAFYTVPAPDGSRPGIFFANLHEPRSRPRYNMEALTAHEAVPGHHLQLAIAQEITGLPALRRHTGQTVFVEGWGLYSERLADEMGLYSNDLSRFGMLNYQAWRACRLVVDTGIHELRWSRQRAIEFLQAHTANSPREVLNEIDRYIIWPGQALSYMVGALEFRRIRREAEEALGDRFDLRSFHDAVLGSGSVPVATLDRLVREWVARQR